MLSTTAKINLRKKNKPEVMLNKQSKQTRNARKNICDREIYQLAVHEKHVTKTGG